MGPRECRHRRAAARVQAFNERKDALPRTASGRAVRPSAAVRAAWREVRLARTRPAVGRRGATFLALLLAETRDNFGPEGPYGPVARWTTTMRLDRGGAVVHRQASGWTTVPAVAIESAREMGATLGDFRRSLRQGTYGVRLRDGRSLDETRETLVHEVLHVLDSDAHIEGYHGRLWQKRLARMLRLFPPTQLAPRRAGRGGAVARRSGT